MYRVKKYLKATENESRVLLYWPLARCAHDDDSVNVISRDGRVLSCVMLAVKGLDLKTVGKPQSGSRDWDPRIHTIAVEALDTVRLANQAHARGP